MDELIKNTADTEATFAKCAEYAQKANVIPAAAFENYRVKRGLREKEGTGVMAGVTNVGNAHGYVVYEGERVADEGKLEYRGLDLVSFIDGFSGEGRFGFEECVYLLLFGKQPTASELSDFCDLLAERRHLPYGFMEDVIMKAPSPDIMNKLSRSVLALYSYDDNPDDTSIENVLN